MIGRHTFKDENVYCKIMNILIYPTPVILFGVTANSQMYNEKYELPLDGLLLHHALLHRDKDKMAAI